jgi:methylamine dehydrogenase heavy chain
MEAVPDVSRIPFALSAPLRPVSILALLLLPLSVVVGRGAAAEVASEPVGRVELLPDRPGPHWLWVSDMLLRRTSLFDGDSGRMLGMLSGDLGVVVPTFSPDHREIYLVSTHYARGTRGQRTDEVTIHDAARLEPLAEVVIPPKRAEHFSWVGSAAVSDDGRFLAVYNYTPATSLSIVDVRERRFVGEIETPGCSLVYTTGARRFAMICGDGSLLDIVLDESGAELRKRRSAVFFDPYADPITEKGVRRGDHWFFVSFDGWVYDFDFSGDDPSVADRWSLLGDTDRRDAWRIGGHQHLALHAQSGHLYSLMHQGGVDTHKQPGTEVWVFDLARRERIARYALPNAISAFARQTLELEPGGLLARLLDWLLPNSGVDRIQVSQDDTPMLFTSVMIPPTLFVLDAESGALLREIPEPAMGTGLMVTP